MNDTPALPAPHQLEEEIFWSRFRARRPVVTWALIGVNAVVFLLGMAWNSDGERGEIMTLFRMGALVSPRVAGFEWPRLFASAFLHFSVTHAAMNLYALYAVGSFLERALGKGRYLALYLLSALGGGLLALATIKPEMIVAGASGAIWGLMTAVLVLGLRHGSALPAGVGMRIAKSQWQVVLLNLAISFIPGISLAGHLGGGLTGAALVFTGLMTRGFVATERSVMLRDEFYSPGVAPHPVAVVDRRDATPGPWNVLAVALSLLALSSLALAWYHYAPWDRAIPFESLPR